ncbi:MAG TPA: hypothetical protein VJT49_03550 [Amycolatopsis sp.]|uniref:hypothetical protein n=1 Tax=Amycolatopsis sp. TaxID=37632 RepID=UPI002B46B978|nr:hypothetical protein [Amycolatopsis sp.]HKS44190.1 hypothetical protein [Amycolatopsis sp.]
MVHNDPRSESHTEFLPHAAAPADGDEAAIVHRVRRASQMSLAMFRSAQVLAGVDALEKIQLSMIERIPPPHG